jgi:UDP-glucose 4-epimerase
VSRVVILGHSGYIGSRLAAAFRAGGVPVVGHSVADVDLTTPASAAALDRLLDADDIVVVLAAIKKQLGDTPEVLAQNLALTINVGRAFSARPVRRVVFFSSAAVYGEDVQHDVITETTPVQPTSFYGIGKFAAERILLKMMDRTPLLILRPALVYGPAEPGYYYGPSGFLQKAQQQAPITLWGDGTELREFLFVDDVVALTERLSGSDVTGVLNLVAGASYTYQDALNEVATLTGESPAVASKMRTKDKVDHRFDNAALRRACPDFVFTTLSEGLRRTARWQQRPTAETRA